MHEHDITDLAMIAACCQRLAARAEANAAPATARAVIEVAATSMTALCSLYGVAAKDVQARIDEIRTAMRGPVAGAAVH